MPRGHSTRALLDKIAMRVKKNRRTMRKNEALIRALEILNACENTKSVYTDMLACLKTLINCDSAALLVETTENYLATATCSDLRLHFARFKATGPLLQALNGRASILHDINKFTSWPSSTEASVTLPLKAAIVIPIRTSNTRLVLVLCCVCRSCIQFG